MKNYKITINGKTYEVGVEEMGGSIEVKSVSAAAPKPKPSPVAVPAPKTAAPSAKETAARPESAKPSGSGDVTAPMTGTVISVAVTEGQQIKKGQLLLVFEAMKMENELLSPCSGTVEKVNVSKGTVLETGMLLVSIA